MQSISIFEIIKVGIGPSSSHTMGPWRATLFFLEWIEAQHPFTAIENIQVDLYGSLAKTGKGHGTDVAVIVALSFLHYRGIDTSTIPERVKKVKEEKLVRVKDSYVISFDPENDIRFHKKESLPYHPNGLKFTATLRNGVSLSRNYYSIGGGFVVTEESESIAKNPIKTPYPCHKGKDAINFCNDKSLSLSQLTLLNEQAWQSEFAIKQQALDIWHEMKDCIFRGCNAKGVLPGGLEVTRRASKIAKKLLEEKNTKTADGFFKTIQAKQWSFNQVNKWISCFALAVNEENASFGRIVTAPTNGAAGVIPAVLAYAYCFLEDVTDQKIIDYILVAGEIGTYFKKGATISAAMGGCQAEIGVSSAMAAGALTDILGGTVEQVFMAAEIAMEHHLGLTCDPIKGLVQIPCIERNSMGAMKAITASNIALESDPKEAKVSFDDIVKTMLQTAKDMHTNYKETAEGGLAISVGLPEC